MLHPYDLPIILCTGDKGFVSGLVELGMETDLAKEIVELIAPDHSSGYCTLVEGLNGGVFCGVMAVKSKTDYNSMAHEATHMAVKTLDWVGVEYTAESHEALAYVVGWLVQQFKQPWK